MIEMNCPHCGHLLRIPERYAGQNGGCKHCRGHFQVPMVGGASVVPVERQGPPGPEHPPRDVQPPPVPEVSGPGVQFPPTAEVRNKRSGLKVAIGILVALVLIASVVVGAVFSLVPGLMSVVGGKKAATPREAVAIFAAALDQGDVDRMLASAYYTDKEGVEAVCKLMAGMRDFEKALDKAYGKPKQGEMQMQTSGGPSFFTLEQIESDGFQIRIDGEQATALLGESGKRTHLIKMDGAWLVDLTSDAPAGAERTQALAMVKTLSDALTETKAKIGQSGTSRQEIEAAFFGQMMGAALGGAKKQQPPPPAGHASWSGVTGELLSESDPLYAVVQGAMDACSSFDIERIKEYVTEDCPQPMAPAGQTVWQMAELMAEQMKQNPQMAQAMQQTETVIEEIRILERTPDLVTLRVTSVSKGEMGGGKGASRNVYREEDGKWKLAEMQMEGFSFSTTDSSGPAGPRIPASDTSQHLALYPGVEFSELEEIPFGVASGPLFGVDESALTCVEGVTQGSAADVESFYKEQMEGRWEDFQMSAGARSSGAEMTAYRLLSGVRTLADGQRVGANVRLEDEGTGTYILIVMGPVH